MVALLSTLEAALLAESAASMPASRILRRAVGLAAIAAAAAVSPAASISRLIAAFARRSIVSLPVLLLLFSLSSSPERPRGFLAMIRPPVSLLRLDGQEAATVPKSCRQALICCCADKLKGTANQTIPF
ncbi:hypothetical protein HMF7854_12015 [Sphingomonas ginkgonis]|uniref:Uncharacterized protein n=1 Tax=Sphingomonas ginkgonis TaxID=2315330 RepID=A0A3R9Y6X8_9SPHN|nr:hypothetical protein HMF7854_12015 [Sphingomonas ginkgonis]